MNTVNFCVNCRIRLNNLSQSRNIHNHSISMRSILTNWISPEQISESDLICLNCYRIIERIASTNNPNPNREYGHLGICLCCGSSLRSLRSHNVPQNCPQRSILNQLLPVNQHRNLQRVCFSCWMRANRAERRNTLQNIIGDDEVPHIPLNIVQQQEDLLLMQVEVQQKIQSAVYKRVVATESRCIFSGCQGSERLRFPEAIRERLLIDHKLFVPENSRLCHSHLSLRGWVSLVDMESNVSDFTGAQMDKMMSLLTNIAIKTIDFNDISNINPYLCHYWLGLNPVQFLELQSFVPALKSIELFTYLAKLRSGDSDRRLSCLLNLSPTTVGRYITTARTSLMNYFVPFNLGFQHITVQEVSRRKKLIPNGLFGNTNVSVRDRPSIVICDGTYVYLQKSSNYGFQKKTYSLHKYQNLVKPFMITCCDGYILDVSGPYTAIDSDAKIMENLFRDEHGTLRQFFRQNDVFVLDRGFRDAITCLESQGYKAYMPESVAEGNFQLTTEQANRSRCVTMVRWVVEVVNGRFKRDFKLFRQDFFNLAASHLMDDFKIAAALLNKFHPPIEDAADASILLELALSRLNTPNHLGDFVTENNLNRSRASFSRIDGNIPNLSNFPILTIQDLRKISIGNYQIKQARSYCGEHLKDNGAYIIEVCEDRMRIFSSAHPSLIGNNNFLLRGRIKSRHISRKVYLTYILVNGCTNEAHSSSAIKAYCCNCLVGMRTVGCCAHVMSILWYLGYARHQVTMSIPPALFLDGILIDILNED